MNTLDLCSRMRRRSFLTGTAASLALSAAGTLPVRAATTPVKGVVELFTSQGCSSCPPADAGLAEMANDPDILALGFHVDYWDYLGWRDTLASPAYSDRQRSYAAAMGERTVYTPQAVINGRRHMNGARTSMVRDAIGTFAGTDEGMTVPVNVELNDDRIAIQVDGGDRWPGRDCTLSIVYFRAATPVEIARGENAGRTMTYANAVRGMQTLGMWDGEAMEVQLPRDKLDDHEADGCAVLLQIADAGGLPGPIRGAANLTSAKSA